MKAEKKTMPAKSKGFSAEEHEAMRDLIRERKAGQANDENSVLAKIAEMKEPDRSMAKKIHALIKANAPTLTPRTWYGMPAYANKEGNVICHFQSGQKFKMRYSTIGFSDKANLDEGVMWPAAFALKSLTPAEEARIVDLVKRCEGSSSAAPLKKVNFR